ncbi:sporulation membrane protein YtaF [Virgibacillus byunsanensis]|uniref:Sporulation membrane protein YtaF n=1 Tax=Virgibacillus byunsanensis TaxID=570945 RepID=A0ABW3LN12_9BACI
MLFYTGFFILVIAVSLDSFGVGITYGMRKIRVPFNALFIIMLCSGLTVLASMTIGELLSSIISEGMANVIGGSILIALGIFCLFNVIRSKLQSVEDHVKHAHQETKRLTQIKTVIKEPQQADLDHSGTISISEALILGFALALDAFAAGLGAAMLGYTPLLTAISIALMSGIFLYYGINTGIILSKSKQMEQMTFLPPLLLIALGIINML